MQSISTILDIIWDNDLFHWVIAVVFLLATSWEFFTCFSYGKKDKDAIKELKRDIAVFSRMRGNKILERLTVKDSNTPHPCDYRYSKSKKYKEWIDEHLETENNKPMQAKGKYILKQYPKILTHSTRSNLRFVGTLCTSIGVLGTFYGIQVGISDIPLNNLNNK